MGNESASPRSVVIGGRGDAAGWRARRAIVVVVAIVAALLPVMMPASPAQAVASVSATRQFGFPRWFEDDGGIRLEPCLENDATRCVLLAEGAFDPNQEVVFPTNFPPEFFYSIVDSDVIPTPGCQGTRPGRALVRLALEGAFANGDPVPGDQAVFARVRVTADGLCPNATYTFTHPYGQMRLTTDVDGRVTRGEGTSDIGCFAGGCTFTEPLIAQMFRGFLRWDPAVPPAATPGYLSGDASVLHPIVGASGAGSANLFRVSGPGIPVLQTNLFTVAAKIAGPLQSEPVKADLGNQPVNLASVPRPITITNVTKAPLTITGVGINPPGPFTIDAAGSNCAGTLAADTSCTVSVVFAPQALGPSTANLEISHTSFRSPTLVPLAGSGSDAVAPSVSSAPAALGFDRVLTGTTSTARGVVVHNAGPGAYVVDGVTVVDDLAAGGFAGDAGRFLPIAGNDCPATGLEPGLSCTVFVAFTPAGQRPAAAELRIAGHVGGASVPLTAKLTARGSIATSSTGADGFGPDGLGADGFPTWYQDNRGVRLQQCFVNDTARCVLLAEPGFDPAAPIAFPGNYPGEAFYYIAESEIMDTPGCGAASPAGRAGFRAAVEQTFGGGAPLAGDQMVFDRIRVNVTSGLCPGREYTFVHPYGEFTFVADDQGGLPRSPGTTDIGCFPAPGQPCNFQLATNSPVSEGFLRWDATAPAAPAGFLGDPDVVHTVVGAPYTKPGSGTPQNRVELVDTTDGTVVAFTNLFSVSGQIHASQTVTRYTNVAPSVYPPLPSGSPLAFGDQGVGTPSGARTVTVESVGTAGLTVAAPTIGGVHAGDFAISGSNCAAVAVGAACSVSVTFTPSTTGPRRATLTVPSDAANPWNGLVSLTGNGTGGVGAPAIQAAPSALAFGDQIAGTTSAARSVTVTNTGTAALSVSALTIGGADATSFSATGCEPDVAPGASCTVAVAFRPTTAGAKSATLTLVSNATGPAIVIYLAGNGTGGAPAVTLDTPALTFAGQLVGTTSAPQVITVTNSGTAPLAISGVAVAGTEAADFASTTTCAGAVAPAGTCTVTVRFAPTATGTRSATVTVTSNAAPATVALTGTGVAPAVTVAPASLTFAAQSVATTSAAQAVTVSNPGTAPLTVSAATLAGANPGDFVLTNGCTTVVAGGACTLSVAFRPTVAGARAATVSVVTDAGPVTVALTGTGVAPAPILTVTPASLTFATQTTATTSPTQTVTVRNTGSATMTVSSVTPTGANAADFVLTNGCATVVVNGTCTVTVAFRPTAAGARTASVSIVSNGGTASVALTGTGVAPAATIAVTPLSLTFPAQLSGTNSAVQTLTVRNTGTAATTVSSVTLTGANPGDFVLANGCGFVAAGGSCIVNVTFRPTAPGVRSGVVSIVSTVGTTLVPVSGTGTAPASSVSPTSLTFAAQAVSTTSATQTVTISNPGSAPLTVLGAALGGLNPGDFVVANTCTTVAAGSSCSFTVAFRPIVTGARTASVSVNTTAGNTTVTLAGTAFQPRLTVTPTSLLYASQLVGTTSAVQTVTISNPGSGTLTLSPLTVGGAHPGDFVVANTCTAVVAGGSCSFTVAFRPTAPGGRNASISIVSNGGTSTVFMNGTATGPAALASPSSLNFAAQAIATTSANQTVTVFNTGTAPLTIASVALGGTNPTDFVLTSGCTTVAPGASCALTVAFRPTAPGARSASVSLATNAGPVTVALTGTGTQPVLGVGPGSLTFASQVAGTTSLFQTVTVSNTGSGTLSISSVTLAGANPGDYTLSNGCFTVGAGASCQVLVAFRPTAAGIRTASLSIVSNAGTGSVVLTGTATAPAVTVTPASLAFGNQRLLTTSAPRSVTITNTGTATLTVSSVTTSGLSLADYPVTNGCFSIAPGASCTLTVAFRPLLIGTRTATLNIATNAGARTVALSGTGTLL